MSGVEPAERLRELRRLLPPVDGPLRAREPIRQLCADIRLERSVSESLQAAPVQAGPLNSLGLVVRTLQRLQETSPAYVRCLVAQLDAWDALQGKSR